MFEPLDGDLEYEGALLIFCCCCLLGAIKNSGKLYALNVHVTFRNLQVRE